MDLVSLNTVGRNDPREKHIAKVMASPSANDRPIPPGKGGRRRWRLGMLSCALPYLDTRVKYSFSILRSEMSTIEWDNTLD